MSRFCGPYGPYRVSPTYRSNRNGNRNRNSNRDRARNTMRRLIGTCVTIHLTGDETIKGKLIAICRGYIVLQKGRDVIYVNAAQVESIAERSMDNDDRTRPRFIRAVSFRDLVRALENEFVKIRWGRRNTLTGFISNVSGNIVTVIVGRRIVQVYIDNIKTIQVLSDRERLDDCSSGNRTSGDRIPGTDGIGGERTSGGRSSSGRSTSGIGLGGPFAPGRISPALIGPTGNGRSRGNRSSSSDGCSRSRGERTSGGRSMGERTSGGRSIGNDFSWPDRNLLPEFDFQPNRYGVPESLLLNGTRKRKKNALKLKKRR